MSGQLDYLCETSNEIEKCEWDVIKIGYRINPPPKYNTGDLVHCEGRANQIWEIEGHYFEDMMFRKNGDQAMYYNLACIRTGETLLAAEEELMLTCKAEYALEYIRMLDENGTPPPIAKIMAFKESSIGKEASTMRPSSETILKLTSREKSELEDELLDRYNETMRFIGIDGQASESQQKQIDAILARLAIVANAQIIKKA